MTILSKACKPDNFESHNSLKLSFTNIWGLHSNFADCESFNNSNSHDNLVLCETNLEWENSSTNMHGLTVYVKEGITFVWDISLENSADSYLCFPLALLRSLYYYFFLYQSPSSSLCTIFDYISSNIDEACLINPSQTTLPRWLTLLPGC